MAAFSLSFRVVFPLFVYIIIGIFANRTGLLRPETCKEMNAFNFRVLFCLNMFRNVYSARVSFSSSSVSYILLAAGYTVATFLILYFAVPYFWKESPRAACIIQGGFRGNTILFAIPIVEMACGAENAGLVSMCASVTVPFYNILAVILFETMRGEKVKGGPLFRSFLKNPLIIGAIAGVGMSLLDEAAGITVPEFIMAPVSALSAMNTPLSLILLGAGLSFGSIHKDVKDLLFVCLTKLIAVPAGIAGICYALGLSGVSFFSLFAIFCVPTAVSSYPMAEQMGGDGPFAAETIAVSSLASLLTVFLWIVGLKSTGLI